MRTVRITRGVRRLGALLVGVTIVGATAGIAGAAGPSLTVGAKNFSGAQILSQVWGQALQKKGYSITIKDSIGPTEVVYPALKNGDIDAYGDYQGTLLTFLGGTPSGNSQSTYKALVAKLAGTGIVASAPAPAVDVNGFYVTQKTASKYKLKTLSDLVKVAPKLSFGGPQECSNRPLCLGSTEQQLYGLKFNTVKKLDTGGPITASSLTNGDIDVGLLFTGSSEIPKGAVLLTDNKGLQPADSPVFLIRKDKATPALLKIVDGVSAKLTTAAYNSMSLAVQNQKLDPATVAASFLKKNKLP
jgi:osmoprotectant transport system substrate-binding protein